MTRRFSPRRRRLLGVTVGALSLAAVPMLAPHISRQGSIAEAIAWLHRSGFGQHPRA
jgi:hypothetical protein